MLYDINFSRLLGMAVLLTISGTSLACREPARIETRTVSLSNTETFVYPTVGGDEEGARISSQARHFSVSEIRRNAETNWVATYVYRAEPGYVGADHAEIEIHTGSDGASPSEVKKVVFQFQIHD